MNPVIIFYMKQMHSQNLWALLASPRPGGDHQQAQEYYTAILKELSQLDTVVAQNIWRSYAPRSLSFPLPLT